MNIQIGDRVLSTKTNNIGKVYSNTLTENGKVLLGVEWETEVKTVETKIENMSICENKKTEKDSETEFVYLDQINSGISFQEAIKDRYLNEEDDVEYFVGIKKVYEYCKRLSSLSLERMNISFCMCSELAKKESQVSFEKSSLCYQRINSLFLNDNLISDWEVLYCILTHLPKLEYLILNGNRIQKNISYGKYNFGYLKVLSLSKTYIPFENVISLCEENSTFPNLEYINVSSNNYSSLNLYSKKCRLKKIDLSFNNINDWESIRTNILENVIQLTSLNISDNNLLNIPSINSDSTNEYEYPNLTELMMDNCNVQSLGSILYISKIFPNLQHFSLRNNKIMNNEKNDFNLKSIVISLIPNIKTYNKSIITKTDIVSSQRYYISQYSVYRNTKLREIDPNGYILCEFVLKNNTPKSEFEISVNENQPIEEKYIDINFIPQCKLLEKLTPTKIKINKKMILSDLKLLIWRLYKIPGTETLEYVFVSKDVKLNIENYDDSYSLADLGIEVNGKIYIQDKE